MHTSTEGILDTGNVSHDEICKLTAPSGCRFQWASRPRAASTDLRDKKLSTNTTSIFFKVKWCCPLDLYWSNDWRRTCAEAMCCEKDFSFEGNNNKKVIKTSNHVVFSDTGLTSFRKLRTWRCQWVSTVSADRFWCDCRRDCQLVQIAQNITYQNLLTNWIDIFK